MNRTYGNISTSRKCRDLHKEFIEQYEYMIEVLTEGLQRNL